MSTPLPEPDHMTVEQVAARLGKKRRWLESRLKDDARSEAPRLQFHGYIGRTRIWDENAYQALRSEIVSADSKSRRAAACSTSLARSGWGSAHNASAKAQALIDQRLGRGSWQKRGASGEKLKSSKPSFTDESRQFPSPQLRVITSKTRTPDRQT